MVAPMTRFLAPAALLAAVAAPAVAAERSYSVVDFDRIQIEGPYQVTIVTGGASQAQAVGDQAAIDRLTVDVQGRTLRIRANRSAWGGAPGGAGSLRVTLRTRTVAAASVIGSGSLALDRARGLRVDLAVSGSGRLAVAAVEADNLSVGLLGSGKVTLAGSARQLRASIQGSGDLDGERLVADDAVLTADTAGRIAFDARRTARVTAMGPGEVTIGGAGKCVVTGLSAAAVSCRR